MKDLKTSIIIPLYNEENTIIKLLKKICSLKRIKLEIIIINDGSTDKSLDLIKKFKKKNKIKIISYKKNRGKGAAIKRAKKYVTGEIVIIQDADLEYNPRDYYKLIKPIKENKTKVVYGSRVLGKNRYNMNEFISLHRIFFNHLLTIVSNFLNNQTLTDAHTCYKVFDTKLFKSIKLKENKFAFCPEITTKISNLNENILEVPISYKGRSYKEGKKISFIDGIEAVFALIKYKFLNL
tara:strand:- start:490 stop:1200 length:711 start_codon:yes stop_codon:yes gene_type:complete